MAELTTNRVGSRWRANALPALFSSVRPPHDQLWEAVLDSAGEGIWGVDLEGRCTFVNRAAVKMLGFEAAELIGKNMHAMVHHHDADGSSNSVPGDSRYSVFWHDRAFTNEIDHVFRKDGSHFFAEMSAQPVMADGGVLGAVVTLRDITVNRQAEDALRKSEKLAAVGQLASSIAHEINNPLEAVINLLYLVRTADTLDNVRAYAELAEVELSRVADVTMQTLRFHRQQTAAAPVDLGVMIPAMMRLYEARFLSRRIELKLKLRPTQMAMLLEGDIRQVLNNLVRNAYDVMPKGGRLSIRLRGAEHRKTGAAGVRITVADTGTGFLPRMRATIFEPFYTSKEETGTGLGLWISRGIVEKHGGSIRMKSMMQSEGEAADGPRHGTVFSIWLPVDASDAVDNT